MRITQDDALSLLTKYAEEKTPVLAAFVTPSLSVARVTGTVRVSIVQGFPQLFVGKENRESDQIVFYLSDCIFDYGDFREEPTDKFEAFLVVESEKGDTLSLFEPKG
jgi:hypothetical protein